MRNLRPYIYIYIICILSLVIYLSSGVCIFIYFGKLNFQFLVLYTCCTSHTQTHTRNTLLAHNQNTLYFHGGYLILCSCTFSLYSLIYNVCVCVCGYIGKYIKIFLSCSYSRWFVWLHFSMLLQCHLS